jgi:GNAT superfamily N-acetyltransferase
VSRLEVAGVTVAGLQADPDIDALLAEYEAEAASPELPAVQPQWEQYAAWEREGRFEIVSVRETGKLIGFVGVLRTKVPHYGGQIAVVESIFVTSGRRRTGAGLKLIRAAKATAAYHGLALLITARAGSALEAILPRLGCRHSNTVFVWGHR